MLEPEVHIELERHISACGTCREMAAQQRAVWDALDHWQPALVSDDFNDRLYRRIAYAIIAVSALVSLPLLDPWLR